MSKKKAAPIDKVPAVDFTRDTYGALKKVLWLLRVRALQQRRRRKHP